MKKKLLSGILSCVLPLFARIPIVWIDRIARIATWVNRYLPTYTQSIIRTNITLCYPQWRAEEQDLLIEKTLYQNYRAILEIPAIWLNPTITDTLPHVCTYGLQWLHHAQKKGGVLFLCPHIGCWEMITHWSRLHAIHMTTLYTPAAVPSVEKMMYRARTRFGNTVAPADASGVKKLFRALLKGEIASILPDQAPDPQNAVLAPFFSQPAHTMTLAGKLLQRTQATPLFICALRHTREGHEGYDVHILPATTLQNHAAKSREKTDARTTDVAIAEVLNGGVENIIHIAPEQYLWSYKRFRKTPSVQYGKK